MGNTDVKHHFGVAVRARRTRLGISQKKLAERADLHWTCIRDIEHGARNVSLDSIEKLAHALKTPVATLFPQPKIQGTQVNGARHDVSGGQPIDILLVEDNPDDVELTLRAFKNARVANDIHVAGDGAEALDYLFCRKQHAHRKMEDPPQLVLLDLYLPKVDGTEVLRRIKEDERTRSIAVVVLSALRDSQELSECRQLGAESCIIKPVEVARLDRVIRQLKLHWVLLKPPEPASRAGQT